MQDDIGHWGSGGAEVGWLASGRVRAWPERLEVVRVVREQVRTGIYRPPADLVAEQLVAWLFAEGFAHTRASW